MQTPKAKSRNKTAPCAISVRLSGRARLEAHGSGAIVAFAGSDSIPLGTFGMTAAAWLQELQTGLPLGSIEPVSGKSGKEIDLLVRRLAAHSLLEFPVECGSNSLIVIEPQVPDYWPKASQLSDAGTLVLSRFAYLRRRGDAMVLESPLSGAIFKICDPKLMTFLGMLAAPLQIKQLQRHEDFPGDEFLGLLLDCQFVFEIDSASRGNLRLAEGNPDLALWDFHDLLFHTRSTGGRHTNPMGGTYPHGGAIPELPALRPCWPGKKIDLCRFPAAQEAMPPGAKLLRERHSTRSFNDNQPITIEELSQFLDRTARVLPLNSEAHSHGSEARRPYPTGGASYELELYLAVNKCEGLSAGLYHYDAGAHGLAPIEVPAKEVKALLAEAASAMGMQAAPQVAITIAARFGRVSWKYSSVAYSLILKDAGVLTQTLYLMAAEMGLGGCAIGLANIERFSKLTGIGFHVEGPVGQFALGRPSIATGPG